TTSKDWGGPGFGWAALYIDEVVNTFSFGLLGHVFGQLAEVPKDNPLAALLLGVVRFLVVLGAAEMIVVLYSRQVKRREQFYGTIQEAYDYVNALVASERKAYTLMRVARVEKLETEEPVRASDYWQAFRGM